MSRIACPVLCELLFTSVHYSTIVFIGVLTQAFNFSLSKLSEMWLRPSCEYQDSLRSRSFPDKYQRCSKITMALLEDPWKAKSLSSSHMYCTTDLHRSYCGCERYRLIVWQFHMCKRNEFLKWFCRKAGNVIRVCSGVARFFGVCGKQLERPPRIDTQFKNKKSFY